MINLKEKTCACPHSIACIWYNQQNPYEFVAHWYMLVYFLYRFTIVLVISNFNKFFVIYRKSTFLDTYDNLILPSNGPKLCQQLYLEPILPPYMRRAPGRPKKQRKKANDEPKKPSTSAYASASTSGKKALIKMNQVTVKCTRYGVLGHNQRTCYGKQAADKRIPPWKQDIFFSFLICF